MGRTPLALLAAGLLLTACGEEPRIVAPEGISGGKPVPPSALEHLTLSHGQLVYVPVYAFVAAREADQVFPFAVNVSVRNTDRGRRIAVTSARYHDTDGKLIREYIENPRVLEPLAATTLKVAQSDLRGGLGGCFLVEWRAEEAVTEPVVEAVMLGQREVRTAAFSTPGRVVEERGDVEPTR